MKLPWNDKRSNRTLLAVFPVIIFLTIVWIVPLPALETPGGKMQTVSVSLGGKTIRAVLANTSESRMQGLLGWNSLDEETGMLLDFLIDAQSAIHMQGMKFPIDAIWADANGEIKLIYQDIQPDKGLTYPSMFPSRYCLEVKAGFCKKYGVQAGQKLKFVADQEK
jgi:uncharacterized protein